MFSGLERETAALPAHTFMFLVEILRSFIYP